MVSGWIVESGGGHKAGDTGEAAGRNVETADALDMRRSRPGPGLSRKAAQRCAIRFDGRVLNLRWSAAMPQYAALDVLNEETAIHVIDETGAVV